MKILQFFFGFVFCFCLCGSMNGYAFNDETKAICEKALEAAGQQPERDKSEVLFEVYTQEIAKMDLKMRENNPELVFRRGFALKEMIESSDIDFFDPDFAELTNQFTTVQNDLQFVLDHSAPESRLFLAAKLKKDEVDMSLKLLSLTEKFMQEAGDVIQSYFENFESSLQTWAKNPSATGKQLRKEIAANVKEDEKIAESFYDFVLLSSDNPDLILGYVKPEKIEVVGVVADEDDDEDDEEDVDLVCRIEYKTIEDGQQKDCSIEVSF